MSLHDACVLTWVGGTLAVVAAQPVAPAVTPSGVDPVRIAFVQVPTESGQPCTKTIADTLVADRYQTGNRLIVAHLNDVAHTRRVVTGDWVCAADPAFNDDGSRLLFAGKRATDSFLQIWELSEGQAHPQRVVSCEADCITPVYLPNGRVLFASLLAGEYEEHGGKLSFSLYDIGAGEQAPTRLTFNPSSEFEPVVLPDGRILHASWQHVGNHFWPSGLFALMLVNSDGTGVFPLTGHDRRPWLKRSPTVFGEDGVAFVASQRYEPFGAGTLLASSLNDPLAPYRTLAPASKGLVADAAGAMNGMVVVAANLTAGNGTFGLYRLQGNELQLLFDDPDYHELKPALVEGRPRPMTRISTVVPGTTFGYLLALNCYQTDRAVQGALKPGAIHRVRVLEGAPARTDALRPSAFLAAPGREAEPMIWPGSATGAVPVRILGEVPVEADGSFYAKVPADRPLRVQLIDQEGFALVNQRAWFWVRPNERRACIGCHEDRELAPANATPLAASRPPADLTDPTGWRSVSFRTDIQPMLGATCALSSCHRQPEPAAGLDLSADGFCAPEDAVSAKLFGSAYANLLARQEHKPFEVGGRRVHPGDARGSPLLWMLYGRPLAPQYSPAPFDRPMASPHPGPMLPEGQLDLIRQWIDLGAQYDSPGGPGSWGNRSGPAGAKEDHGED